MALPSGILLRRPLRRQFEYTDVIRSDPNDIEAEVLRLWEENKVLRDKNEKLLLDLVSGFVGVACLGSFWLLYLICMLQ